MKYKKAPARARAKEEYLLTTKLFCGYCKEMMTGFSGTGKLGKVYRYYECKGTKKHTCKKKRVKKEYIENVVIEVCRGLLTKENINRISKEISKLFENSQDTFNLKRLKKQLSENERKHRNLINAVSECDIESLRRTFYSEILELESQKEKIEEEIREEEKLHIVLTEPEIKFFLTSLKNGSADDIKYRNVLITTFNSGDKPVTINNILLSEIEANESNNTDIEGLFIDNVALPIENGLNTAFKPFFDAVLCSEHGLIFPF